MNEFYGSIDTLGNYFSNLRILPETTEMIELKANVGHIFYNEDIDAFVGVKEGNVIKSFNQSNSFSKVLTIRKYSGNVELNSIVDNDTLSLEEGDNIRFEVTGADRKIKINANLNYTANNFFQVFGDSSNLEYLITHNLGTSNVVVSVIWEGDDLVNPNTNVLRYVTEDENTVKVVLSEPPNYQNSLKAIINSRHGDKGFQGIFGAQGIQGFRGHQGNQGIPGYVGFQYTGSDEHKTIRVNSVGDLEVTDIVEVVKSSNSKSINLNTQYNNYGVSLNASNITSNVMVIEYSSNNYFDDNLNLLELSTYNTLDYTHTDRFSVNVKGKIKSNFLIGTSNALIYGTSSGEIKKFTEDDLPNIFIPRRNKVILPYQTLLNSYTINPMIVSPIAGKSIIVHALTGKLNPGSTPFDFGLRQVTIEVQTTNDPLITLNSELLDYDNSIPGFEAIFHYSPNKTATPGSMFTRQSMPLVLRTYTSNPSVGNGSLELWIYYTYI
jgi:hypothetical protein